MRGKPLALYVHIPFCIRKCAYCDFLSAPGSEETRESYVNLLCQEIEKEAVCCPDHRGETVFFGGGTPTVLRPEQLERILCKLKECFPAGMPGSRMEPEITLECNPGTVNGEDLQRLRAAGFNRLSIGLQSMDNGELKKLGRIHTREEFLETFRLAREAGFGNINVDLMSALPGQSVESYVNSLEEAAGLHPEHISAYSLIIEEGTPFYALYGKADAQRRKYGGDREHLLPTEEEERRMYELTWEILEKRGYHRYEISNYARPGFACRHNITYWRRGDYLGLGLGAASLMDNCRFSKPRDLREYEVELKGYRTGRSEGGEEKPLEDRRNGWDGTRETDFHRERQLLTLGEQMEEYMFLGLRLTEGISREGFFDSFGVPVGEVYGDVINKLKAQNLLAERGDRLFLTERGIDVSNVVLAEFLLP